MKTQTFILLIALFKLTGCYTLLDSKNVKTIPFPTVYDYIEFPDSAIINSGLFGSWEKTYTIMDYGRGKQQIIFNSNGTLKYKETFSDDLVGEYASISDTLYVRFYSKEHMELLTFRFNNGKLVLKNLYSPYRDRHHSISTWEAYKKIEGN